MRTDEKLKKEIYIQRIMHDFIQKHHYPNHQDLDMALSSIDLKESLFKVSQVVNGELFNPKVFNLQTSDLESDLLILYQLVKQYTLDELNKLSEFADTTLIDLEKKAEFYLTKSRMEMQSSDLGYTALYMHGPFKGQQKDDYFLIDCGNVDLTDGSTIHLLVEGYNIYYARLKLESADHTFFLTPYSLNMQNLKLPGNPEIKEKEITLSYSPASNSKILIPYTVNKDSEYIILAGKGKLSCKTDSASHYESNSYYACFEETMIDFYVKDATSIRIKTSHRPLYTNYDFSQETIKLDKGIRHFYLQMPAKSAIEIFLEGGEIYAQKNKGIVQDEKLYYVQNTPFKDFLVIEKLRKNKTNYKATLEVRSTLEQLGIDSILIKEMVQ